MIPEIDKLKHFYIWTMGFIILSIVLVQFLSNDVALYISYVVTIITAGGKEVIKDWRMKQGTPEWMDFWFSILAPTLIMLLYICL